MNAEPDLYPPDIDVLTPEARTARDRAMIGTFLVTLGTGILLERTFDNNLDVFWLAVGLALLVGWSKAPKFPMFAVGAIMTGFAAGGFVESAVSMPFETTIGNLFAAAGFFAVYARYPYKAKWALVGTAICSVIAVAAAGVELIGLIPAALTSAGLPILLIAGGSLLLFRNSLPPKTVKIGLIVVAVMFVMSGASSVDKWDGPEIDFTGPFDTKEYTEELPDLGGDQLIVVANRGSIDLRTTTTSGGSITALVDGRPGGISFEQEEDALRAVFRTQGRPFGGTDGDVAWRVVVPAGSRVSITTDEGLAKVDVDGIEVDVTTDEGPVLAVVRGGTGRLAVVTDEGPIQVNSESELPLDVTARSDDGPVVIDGNRADGAARRPGDGPQVELTSDEGPIIVADHAA